MAGLIVWAHARLGVPRRAAALILVLTVAGTLTGCFSAPPQIISLEPNRGSTGINADMPIRVIFDHEVVHESVANHFFVDPPLGCDVRAAFTAASTAPCHVTWLTDQPGFSFQHEGAIFTANTKYTFDLSAGVTDHTGSVNSLDHRWDITAAQAPIVVATDPLDGAVVARDQPLSVNFSRPMDERTAAEAVALTPPVPGTHVVRNFRDHGRFLILPGRPLDRATAYTLTVSTSATDEHRLPLAQSVAIHFRTGEIQASGHAVVLANHAGEGATDVILAQLQPVQFGEPIASSTLHTAPRCVAPTGCGLVAPGNPLFTFRDVQLAPGSRWLAIVESDETIPSTPIQLRIIDLASGLDRTVIPGASGPAWSLDGASLAYAGSDGSARLYQPVTGATLILPGGAPLSGRPVWLGDGEGLALPVAASAGRPMGVDLAVPSVQARYPLPQLTGELTHPVAAPTGSALAVRRVSGPTPATWVTGAGDPTPQQLAGDLTPVGFLDSGRLLCLDNTAHTFTVVALTSRDATGLAQSPPADAAATVVVAPSGRQLAYVAIDADGITQGFVANADGSGAAPLTEFGPGLAAIEVSFQ